MGLLDSFFGDVGSTVDTSISDIFGTDTGFVSDILGGFSAPSSGVPVNYAQPVSYPMAQPVMGSVPMVARAAAAGIARWSVQFPSLWQALQKYRAAGISMTIAKLWSMFKKVGPSVLATYIGAQAVADLVTYKATHKGRRMNVANTRALGRSLRRLKGFEKLSHRVSAQLGRAASRGRSRRSGRCSTCRKSPCAC